MSLVKALVILLAVAALVTAVFAGVWLLGVRRAFEAAGTPTPESARVKVETAEDKARAANEATLEEVRNATREEKLRAARARIQRGLRGK